MLTWNVGGLPEPSLRMWTAGGDRMLLTQAGRPVLLAQVGSDRCDVSYLRTGRYQSPVPPVTAAQARRRPPSRTSGWAGHFRAALTSTATGPLRDGAWAIARAPGDFTRPGSVATAARGELDWFTMNLPLLPLGPVPDPGEGRVKAYRKLARDGLLPPVLTWWVSGLQALVILDGLCRLAAARAQGTPATILALAEVDPARASDAARQAVGGYQARAHGIRNLQGDRAERAHAWLSQGLAGALQAAQASGITRAWPLPGGTARWQAIAENCGWGH